MGQLLISMTSQHLPIARAAVARFGDVSSRIFGPLFTISGCFVGGALTNVVAVNFNEENQPVISLQMFPQKVSSMI